MRWGLAGALAIALAACGGDAGRDDAADATDAVDGATDAIAETDGDLDAAEIDAPDQVDAVDADANANGDGDTVDGDTIADGDGDTGSESRVMLCHAGATTVVPATEAAAHRADGDLDGPCSPLAATLAPPSHTLIDCGGRTVVAGERVGTFAFLHDVVDVTITRCVVRGFDSGVIVLGGGGHDLHDDDLAVASEGVHLYRSHDNRVARDVMRYGVVGVWLDRDSDRNVVEACDLAPADGPAGFGRAVLVADEPALAVASFIVDGAVQQVPNADAQLDDNVVRDNSVGGGDPFAIGVMARSNRTLVQGNHIASANVGIVASGAPDSALIVLAGLCTRDITRYCASDGDCEDLGACVGVAALQGDVRAVAGTIEGNQIAAALVTGIQQGLTRDSVVRGNSVEGARTGILLSDDSVAAIAVDHNVVAHGDVGLRLVRGSAAAYGATVRDNDFVGNAHGIASDVAAHVDGNYWGHDACPGFVAADGDGLAADCAPYAVPVADAAHVPADAAPCPSPPELDRVCRLDAPALVSSREGEHGLSYTVVVGAGAALAVHAYGLVAGQRSDGVVAPGLMSRNLLSLGADTERARVRLVGDPVDPAADESGELDLVVFASGCEAVDYDRCDVVAASRDEGPIEQLDLPPLAPGDYSAVVDATHATVLEHFTLTSWIVTRAAGDLVATAPGEVSAGASVTIVLSWPADLAPGDYLGVVDYANDAGPLGQTLVEVTVPVP